MLDNGSGTRPVDLRPGPEAMGGDTVNVKTNGTGGIVDHGMSTARYVSDPTDSHAGPWSNEDHSAEIDLRVAVEDEPESFGRAFRKLST